MYNYIIGTVTEINANNISLDNNGVGYLVYTPNPYMFELGKEYKVYIYEQVREDEHSLYGFKDMETKELFLKLIDVKGLGPKMTMPMLATGSVEGIKDAIERENLLYLKKFPKIGDKVAKQMILDLKGKLGEVNTLIPVEDIRSDLMDALRSLGYKDKEINGVIPKIKSDISIEEQIREALKLLLNS